MSRQKVILCSIYRRRNLLAFRFSDARNYKLYMTCVSIKTDHHFPPRFPIVALFPLSSPFSPSLSCPILTILSLPYFSGVPCFYVNPAAVYEVSTGWPKK